MIGPVLHNLDSMKFLSPNSVHLQSVETVMLLKAASNREDIIGYTTDPRFVHLSNNLLTIGNVQRLTGPRSCSRSVLSDRGWSSWTASILASPSDPKACADDCYQGDCNDPIDPGIHAWGWLWRR